VRDQHTYTITVQQRPAPHGVRWTVNAGNGIRGRQPFAPLDVEGVAPDVDSAVALAVEWIKADR